jgi:hypothetical protein
MRLRRLGLSLTQRNHDLLRKLRRVKEIQVWNQAEVLLHRGQLGTDGRKLVAEEGAEGVEVRHAAPPYGELTV